MRRPFSAIVWLAFLLSGPASLAASTAAALDEARSALNRDQPEAAVTALETALPDVAAADRAEWLGLLRRAYEAAARRAEAGGRTAEAETYRENLAVIARAPATAPQPAPVSIPSAAPAPIEPKAPPPAVAGPPPEQPAAPQVADADAHFLAKRYDEAGRVYAALDAAQRLPKARRDHWAYCRCVEVVRRINARPAGAEDWAAIDVEIQRIRALSPNNWYGEYLRNRAAERAPGRPLAPSSNKVVVRGAAPEEPAPAAPRAQSRQGRFAVLETANFRILHDDAGLAGRVADAAEAAREAQLKRWTGAARRAPWSPRCDIYLYPTARIFSEMTRQPEDSPGFSTMGMNGGQIIARRINLRADHPNLVAAVLPHEITHVVLADLFPHQQIPRWADEGIAVLSEPDSEQHLRVADLEKPLSTGKLFRVDELMVMDYPDGKFWGLYYAQSVSLTRFLVELGTPTQFIQFVRDAQRNGAERELRRIYKIKDFPELHDRWVAYARTKSAEVAASRIAAGERAEVTR